ncbi:ferritin-like domain-containing protein [Xylophilus sp. GW821-FHT01B05]
MPTLRHRALSVLQQSDPDRKAELARGLGAGLPSGAALVLEEPAGLPGRPALPPLVGHTKVKQRSIATPEGRAILLHALAHIELNAIDLAADAVWRFAGMPDAFYEDWAQVAREEALHFQLLRDHLQGLGYRYGDFPAHNALWEMAERTRHDVLARVALVPRTMEARGLDASPAVRQKLISVSDRAGAAIIDIILRDEIGHVAVGNRWYGWLCAQRGLEPVATYAELTKTYQAPRLRGPFNLPARQAAGFTEAELQALVATIP